MKVLIYAIPDDTHVSAVAWGLRKLGIEPVLWMASDLPDFCQVSARFDGERREVWLRQRGDGAAVRLDDAKLIWNRRFAYPIAPGTAHEADKALIENQCYEHMNGIRHLLGRHVRTINTPAAQSLAARKTVQIDQARRSGFLTPATLVSNDYPEIVRFWKERAPLVVKPFKMPAWRSAGRVYTFFTSLMPEPTEAMRESLELSPQIFQEKVDRVSEVRLIAFGDRTYALNMTAQGGSSLTIDVRMNMKTANIRYTRTEVPSDIQLKVTDYMRALGIEYGAFDFAVDGAGHWIFLECNEGGQFLFLERAVPDLGILDGFCRWFAELIGIDNADVSATLTMAAFDADGGSATHEPSSGPHKLGVRKGHFLHDEDVHLTALEEQMS